MSSGRTLHKGTLMSRAIDVGSNPTDHEVEMNFNEQMEVSP